MDLSGDWALGDGVPNTEELSRVLAGTDRPRRIAYDTDDLGSWDSSLLTYLVRAAGIAAERAVEEDRGGLRSG